jgi:hypothetical protein
LEICLNSIKRVFLSLFVFSILAEATTIKVASYNVENLFDLEFNGGEYPQYIPYTHNWNSKSLKLKLKNLSEVICEIDADIIALQEIENINALKLLQKSLKYYGCAYRYFSITKKATSSTQVALLSRLKIESSKEIRVPKRGVRDILEVKVLVDGNPLFIFVNHWSSKRGGNSSTLSARVLKRELEYFRGREYILIGDFNSNYNEKRLYSFLNSSRHICNLDINSHYNLWYELPIYQRWSYNFYGKKEGLDNILIPYTLLDGKRIDYKRGSFNRFKPNYLFHKRGYILRWEYKNNRHVGVGYSDHLPIFAYFSTKPFKFPNCSILDIDIFTLKSRDVQFPVRLRFVKVIQGFKNGIYIQDKSDKIKVYGLSRKFRVGEVLDIIVYRVKRYKGELEIIDFDVEKSYYTMKN